MMVNAIVTPAQLQTPRLLLRRWTDADLEPFARLNADPAVMEYFPAPLTRHESDQMVERIEESFEARGLGLWAVEVKATRAFIGFVRLWPPTFEAHFTPATEVGWRLAHDAWGNGYAAEAASAAIEDGFARLGLSEIVSFTSVVNQRSRRVMEKLGMTHDPPDDFDHPRIAEGHPLRPHVLYRLRRLRE
jgi:RimJ/RimL family protein N-acetyltransferase